LKKVKALIGKVGLPGDLFLELRFGCSFNAHLVSVSPLLFYSTAWWRRKNVCGRKCTSKSGFIAGQTFL